MDRSESSVWNPLISRRTIGPGARRAADAVLLDTSAIARQNERLKQTDKSVRDLEQSTDDAGGGGRAHVD